MLLGFSVANPVAAPTEDDSQHVRRDNVEIRGTSSAEGNGGGNWNDHKDWNNDHRPKNKCPKRWDSVPFLRNPKSQFWGVLNVIGYFFDCPKYNTVPLYALVNYETWDFFYTANAWERDQAVWHLGYKSKGTAGYIFPNEWCGGVPLFRLYSWRSQQHFYTTSWSEKAIAIKSGFSDEGVMGYIFLP